MYIQYVKSVSEYQLFSGNHVCIEFYASGGGPENQYCLTIVRTFKLALFILYMEQ